MHTCTNCAHSASIGGEAASLCTNCGVVAADAASLLSVSVYAAAALGVAYLAFKAGKAMTPARVAKTA